MFTQCPTCDTIFKISAEVLRAAAGEVRCGRCGEIFNALRSLAEEPGAFTTGESAQEQEVRADRILRSTVDAADAVAPGAVAPVATGPDAASSSAAARSAADQLSEIEEFASDGAPGTQIAQLEIQGAADLLDWDDDPAAPPASRSIADDPSMEFTLPPGELDRIFVEARPHHFVRGRHNLLRNAGIDEIEPVSPEKLSRNHSAARPAEGENPVAGGPAAGLPAVEAVAATVATEAVALPRAIPGTPPPDEPAPAAPVERIVPDFLRAALSTTTQDPAPAAAARVEPRREDWIEQIIPTRDIEEFEPAREPHRGRWAAAAALFALLLGVQVVHHHRDALAQSPAIGSAVRSLYQIAGYPIPLKMNLGAFEVRQWGVTGDASANGTLRVRASLINTGAAAQPYPLLRLTLADRFGTRVGMRDFLPAEYLRRAPSRPLDPGERADTLVEIVDPGKTAEGFEIDVCERRLDARVVCANDSPARAR